MTIHEYANVSLPHAIRFNSVVHTSIKIATAVYGNLRKAFFLSYFDNYKNINASA